MKIRLPLIRFLLEAGFLILVAVAVGLANLSWVWILVVMSGALLLVAVVERSETRARAAPAEETPEPEAETHVEEPEPQREPGPEREPEPELEPEPKAEPEPEPVLAAVPALPPDPEPEPGPPARAWRRRAPERDESVVRLQLPQAPREWNVWELERLASAAQGEDPAKDEERAMLVLSLRQYADASGVLPVDFDALVREAFEPELLDGLASHSA